MTTVYQIWKGDINEIAKQEEHDIKRYGGFDPDILKDRMTKEEVIEYLLKMDNPDEYSVEDHVENEDGDFVEGGDLDSGSNFLKRFRSIIIRQISGLSRVDFCKKYNIPVRTVEDWDWGKKTPSDWVLDLLERAVREDFS